MIGPVDSRGTAARAHGASPLQDGRYLLLETLGRGGMASVFRTFDRVEQRLVALKATRDERRAGPAHPLAAEFDAWVGLDHPNIVRALDLRTARSGWLRRGTPYLVLEHIEGRPAHHALEPGRVAPEILASVAEQVLKGLAQVHCAGLVHRDVKPGNVLVATEAGDRPRVKLTDFGLAARRGVAGAPGTFSGSLPYAAPETFLGRPVDGRADLYGLGILLYKLATGRMPVEPPRLQSLLRWHLDGPPLDPRRARPGLPPRLSRFIRRLTARDVEDRPASTCEALDLLGAVPERSAPSARWADRGLLAALRLALDAARLGARRRFVLPGAAPSRAALLRQVRVWTSVHGLAFHILGGADAERGLEHLVLRLLIDRDGDAARLNRRYGLERRLPLSLPGGQPAVDATRLTRAPHGETADAIVRFLLDCSRRRTLVLLVERIAPCGPLASLTRRVVGELTRRARGAVRAGRGGLLLLE